MTASSSKSAMLLGTLLLLAPSCGLAQFGAPAGPPSPSVREPGAPADPANDFKDADSLLRAAVPRTLRNRREATTYTYDIAYRNRNFNLDGKLLTDYSAIYELIFVGDLPYRRMVEENHRPLSSEAAASEGRRYDQAFADRARMSIDQKRSYLSRPWNVDVPLNQLTNEPQVLFTNRIVGEEAVDDRPAIVVECLPRPDVQPADDEQRRALHKRVKLWIDRDDLIVDRIEATLVADDAAMKAGTVARIEFLRKDALWLPARSDVTFEAARGSELVRGETIETNSDFHRFHVDVRLLEPANNGRHQVP